MPYNEMTTSLEDNLLSPGVAGGLGGGVSAPVSLSDLYSLDVRTIYNKTISSFLILYGMFYLDIDRMIFSAGDSDMMLALKNAGVYQAVDSLGAMVRRQFPGIIM
jgi:hypothetical protein